MWVLVGLLVGILFKWVMPGPDPRGLIVRMLIGIAGAIIGGMVWFSLGLDSSDGFLANLTLTILGAVLLLWGHRWALSPTPKGSSRQKHTWISAKSYRAAAAVLLLASVIAFTLWWLPEIEQTGPDHFQDIMTGVTHKFLIGVVAVRAVICVLLAHFVYQGKRIDLAIVYIGLEILIPTLVTLAYVQSGGPPPHALRGRRTSRSAAGSSR